MTPLRCVPTATLITLGVVILAGCQSKQTDEPYADAEFLDLLVYGKDWPDLTSQTLDELASQKAEANRKAEKQLKKIVTFKADNAALDQAVAFVRDTAGVNIAVNWPALELVGIDHDSLVTMSLTRVPAGQFLELMLDQVSADAFDDDKAGYRIDNGIVKISTLRDLRADTFTRVYNIRWLFEKPVLQASLYRDHQRAAELIELLEQDGWWEQYGSAPGFDLKYELSGTSSGGSPRGGGGGCGLFGDDDEEEEIDPETLSHQERIDRIVELITTTIGDPDEWLDEVSTLVELNGNLIIRTTLEDHLAIRQLLVTIQMSQANHFKSRAKAIEVFLLLQDAEALRLKQQYKRALVKVEQALRVDPDSVEVQAIQAIITEALKRDGK